MTSSGSRCTRSRPRPSGSVLSTTVARLRPAPRVSRWPLKSPSILRPSVPPAALDAGIGLVAVRGAEMVHTSDHIVDTQQPRRDAAQLHCAAIHYPGIAHAHDVTGNEASCPRIESGGGIGACLLGGGRMR